MPDETYDSDVSGNHLVQFSVAAVREGTRLTAWIYLGVTPIFTHTGHTSDYPAGIEDFAGIAVRRFSENLARALSA